MATALSQRQVHPVHEDVEGVEAVHQEDERVAQLADGHFTHQQQDGHYRSAPLLHTHSCEGDSEKLILAGEHKSAQDPSH